MLRHCVFLITILILAQFTHVQPFFEVFAEDHFLPDWVFKLAEFWQNGDISDHEFGNAVKYLQDLNTVQLVMEKEYDPITNFLITISIQKESTSTKFSNCSSDWYITGYFTPIESDYSGYFMKVQVDNNERNYRSDFLDEIRIEGWGRTLSDDYLGWYYNSYHLSDYPLDAKGNKLVVQSVAVDPYQINIYEKNETKLIIPNLPSPWNEVIFIPSDMGPAIVGKHIDVYTGEGQQAKLETERITGDDNKVCTNWLANSVKVKLNYSI